ncbi:S8 family serine peptidase [Streptomyces sp. NPDC002181]|uniref:S8 family serine peptidase n=1 Tax=Streptomyces sp. NPDC002181 TaxID=3364635 RepID=UPI0036773315
MRPRVLAWAAVAAAVPCLALALPPSARAAAPAANDPVALPALRWALAPGEPCTAASQVTAETEPWTVKELGLPGAWQLSDGQGVTVGVVDTGVANGLRALVGRVDGGGKDCVGHGSFAAGVIAGSPLAEGKVDGVASGARVLAIAGTDERGATDPQRLAAGIRAAVDGGARIVYVARALLDGREELTAAVAYATQKRALVIAPATPDAAPQGQGGQPDLTARPYFPAFVPQVLSVAAHGPGGSPPKKAPAPFAPDLSAPGEAVVGIGPSGTGHYLGSGSSLAAAHAAGVAALVLARDPRLTPEQLSQRLVASAYPADVPQLDAYAAVAAVPAPERPHGEPREPAARIAAAPHQQGLRTALFIGGGTLGLVVLVAAGAFVVPRGRDRGWQPADSPPGNGAEAPGP